MKIKEFLLYGILLVLILTLVNDFNSSSTAKENEIPKPNPNIVIPKPENTPKPSIIDDNFVYDNFSHAIDLANKYNKHIIVVFGAEWCPYCEILKKDSRSIKEYDKYIVCFIDTDNKNKNNDVIGIYKPRSLPTSVIITNDKQELSRKIGYRKQDYIKWLNSLPD